MKVLNTIEMRPLSELVPYARNSRTHSDAQIEQIAASIREFGWTIPVLVDSDGTIIAGHGRVAAAERLGIADVPVLVANGWTEQQRRAYVIADNKLADNAGWDTELLVKELKLLSEGEFSVELTGFSNLEIEALSSVFDGESVEDALSEWNGFPEFEQEELRPKYALIVNFNTPEDRDAFAALIGQKITENTRSIYYPEQKDVLVADKAYV